VSASVSSFLEELLVRRELSDNYCHHNGDGYDDLARLYPAWEGAAGGHWAQRTLEEHASDPRPWTYGEAALAAAATHDALWNAAQLQMVTEGRMHGFLRMYWAKKILEWTPSPADALRVANALNDRFALDGCDPNGYVGVAWAVAGLHDNAWKERAVTGKVRYMNLAGCRRKFDVDAFVAMVASSAGVSVAGSAAPE